MQNITEEDWKEINKLRKAQGDLHESAALKSIGSDAINLNNDVTRNFPTFDISSSKEICSVKSHISQDGVLTDQNINSYIHDFEHMIGWGRNFDGGLNPMQQDAERIVALRDQGKPIPESLSNASREEIVKYIEQNTVMRIPTNHVGPVQDALEKSAREIPENYYLSSPPTDSEIAALRDRVKPTGMDSQETLNQLNAQNSNDKSGQLVYEGNDTRLAVSTGDPSNREYLIGSPHGDYEAYKGILKANDRYKIGQELNTAQIETPLVNIRTVSSTIMSSEQVNQESSTQAEMDQYFHDKYGHDPYTDPAYPLASSSGSTAKAVPSQPDSRADLTNNGKSSQPVQGSHASSGQSSQEGAQADSEDNNKDYYYSYGQ